MSADIQLDKTAFAVREHAYAPYSSFKVGAAVRSVSGVVYSGCNVENIAYPEGTCAEAGAIAAMVAAGETRLVEVFVVADSKEPVSPCGGCRQKLAEFSGGDAVVTLANLDGVRVHMTMAELLPGAFGADHMDADHKDRD
ncbi:Cytidine deaminase [Shimia sp. SK013]|uniref:cytidine deaminase n=1 Tax=Shimia sp. SK013 TaxID=1389006 RepID=UPI0006B5F3AE|nr:cytidine deaminase [Shimia sp. SK013]KPA21837.1 Cytidine deaminase [Shimia sp. SK013]